MSAAEDRPGNTGAVRPLAVAYGNSCHAKSWSNKPTLFEDLKDQLRTPIRTSESTEEYGRMRKAQREAAKDHGGFVGGTLSKGRRLIQNVESRSMVTLDGDNITPEFLDSFESLMPYASALYTTHGSTPEEPRARVIIPMTRDVTPEEFIAVSRYVAQTLGIDYFDKCSYKPNQLMYWPSAPRDGVFVYKETDGPWLDPDVILTAHPGWQDPTRLPTSKAESKANEIARKKVADPLTKPGVVGLFNRVFFPITKAIETFLSDVYEPTDRENRWHLIEAHSAGGVEIYEDKFVYSHHAKDPAYERLCNAFDLVRVHRFGDLDDKASYSAMCDLAMSIDEVRAAAVQERMASAGADFGSADGGDSVAGDAGDAGEAEAAGNAGQGGAAQDDSWTKKLVYKPRTLELEKSIQNLLLILENDPDFRNFGYNAMVNRVQLTGPVPWEHPAANPYWRDADTIHATVLIAKKYGAFPATTIDTCLGEVIHNRRFHPVRDWLDALPPWDGVPRVERLFIDCLEADDTEYVRAVTRKLFAAAVSRIYKPGTKFDSMVVLDGAQGIGKSTLLKELVGEEYYSDALSLTDMDSKAAAENLQGFWIVEISELAGMKRADVETVKKFLSTADDKYRPSYGKVVESHPRQCVVIATVNGERGYLRDITGNRRFWVVKCRQTGPRKDWAFTDELRAQFWAEAKVIREQGEKLYLEGMDYLEAEKMQVEAMEKDDRQGIVEEYLDTLLPRKWPEMDLHDRRDYLANLTDPTTPKGEVLRETVCNAEIWCEALGKNIADMKPSDSYAIAALMKSVTGWNKSGVSKRLPIYGKQKIYMREKLHIEVEIRTGGEDSIEDLLN